jgi:hypothetical protein
VPLFLRKPSPAFLTTLAVLLALLHAVMALTATTGKSTTADEIGHLTAGLAYNSRADYRLQPENGNLPQRWTALPMTWAGVRLPSPQTEAWQKGDVWRYGRSFFYQGGLATDEFLFLGRMMIGLFSAATGLLIFHWSRALFGWRGAFLSLGLFVFCPAFLAHGALATSDVVMTFFFLASVGAWWRHLEKPGAAGAALSAITLGLAFVAKFSAVLLPPMLAAIAVIWAAGRAPAIGWRRALGRLAGSALVHALTVWAIIWLFYGFRFSAFSDDPTANAGFNHPWSWMLEGLGTPGKFITLLRDWHALPEAWLFGLAFVLGFSEARGAFLNGDYSLTGWVGFFPFAFLVKTTLPLLAVAATLLVAGTRQIATRLRTNGRSEVLTMLRPLTPLAVLFGFYWATSLASHLNIGHRHLLPVYPVIFIGAGWLGRWLDVRRPFAAAVLGGLLLWHAVESWRIRPHYLAYFNAIVGGPANGWKHLVDSSLDWGQDLPGLADWLARNNVGAKRTPVFLAYFGTGEPAYEKIDARIIAALPDFDAARPWRPLAAGIYAVSATQLQQVYSDQHAWTLPLEREFQELRASEPALLAWQNDRARRAELAREFPAARWREKWRRYEALRFARLCFYLRVRAPDANAGYSVLIYRLSAEEVAGATGGSLDEWKNLIEQAAARR